MKKVFVTGGSGFVGQNLIPLLLKNNYEVIALARSSKTAEFLKSLGATTVLGDLSNYEVIKNALQNCHSVFHLAAIVDFSKTEKELRVIHVDYTKELLKLADSAGVSSFVYLSAASVIMNGKPIFKADETFISNNIIDGYSITKLEAENIVLQANKKDFRTIALRPSIIWGKGEPHVLPILLDLIKNNKMQFIGGGKHKFITCHVTNVCHALLLADTSAYGGKTYFITDGEPQIFKEFIQKYVGTQGVVAPDKHVSLRMAKVVAVIMDLIWKGFKLKGEPPLTKATINAIGMEFTPSDFNARQELNYKSIISVEEGMSEMKK